MLLRQVNFDLPPEEVVASGHQGCAGCGAALAMRLVLKVLGRKTMVVVPRGCWSIIDGPWPCSAAGVPLMHAPAAAAADMASGVHAALAVTGDHDTTVCALVADARSPDFLRAMSSAVTRRDRILFVCYDTQIEAAVHEHNFAATPAPGALLRSARPVAGLRPDTDPLLSIAALGVLYAATASVAFPGDLAAKLARAQRARGPAFLQILSPCPPGWHISAGQTVHAARMAVMTRAFPLVETEQGHARRITLDPGHRPLEEYVVMQGRFRHLLEQPETMEATRAAIDDRWQSLQ